MAAGLPDALTTDIHETLAAIEPHVAELQRVEARSDLLAFTIHTFPGYRASWHHRIVADKLTALARGDITRLILTMPPRRGKSELASRRLPAFFLGNHPDLRVIGASSEAGLATDFSRDVKHICRDEKYGELFPGVRIASGRDEQTSKADEWNIVGHRGGYLARGIGGGITGRGGDLLVIDDPVKDEEEARSPAYRERLWRWYHKVLWTRQAPGARILIIMTRWHLADLVGRLLEEARINPLADQWEVVTFPEIREDLDNLDDPREVGEVLWPERYSLKNALQWRSVDPEGFSALGQQRPVPSEGAILKAQHTERSYFRLVEDTGDWLQSWDLKQGSKDPRSSFAVGQVWFRPYGSADVYLVDQVRGRWDVVETMERIALFSLKWPRATRKLVEDKADGRAVVRMMAAKIPGLVLVSPLGDKISRLRAVLPLWEAGNILLPVPNVGPWISEFIHEVTSFPAAAHDDQVDAMSQALRWYTDNPPATGQIYESLGKSRASVGMSRWL